MKFDPEKLPSIVDVTAVAENTTAQDVEFTMNVAKTYGCAAAIVNPSYLQQLMKARAGRTDIRCGTTGSFPFGCDGTAVKLYGCQQSELLGAQEIDVVMNVGEFLSGNLELTEREFRLLAETLSVPIKVIIEAPLLSDEQIVEVSRLAADCGVHYVKTATGFSGGPVAPAQVRLMKEAVGDKAKVKASGGIRTVAQCEELIEAGASRLGIGVQSALAIFRELDSMLGRESPVIL
ncbi:MAG: deoxyribose-phosphate aldolase [Clostridia bacterium]|nr:deoxyribose-phosphate aldolase [Clostridia bacterium]